MSDLSRRDLLRASAGAAAIAVPMSALSGGAALASPGASVSAAEELDASSADLSGLGSGPVMFCVHDAARGEVSILHGTREVMVKDRRLVAQILRAARSHGK